MLARGVARSEDGGVWEVEGVWWGRGTSGGGGGVGRGRNLGREESERGRSVGGRGAREVVKCGKDDEGGKGRRERGRHAGGGGVLGGEECWRRGV